MIEYIKKLFEREKAKQREYQVNKRIKRSKDLFNIREHNSEIWLTYGGYYVCPMSLFKESSVQVLEEIRKLYVIDEDI